MKFAQISQCVPFTQRQVVGVHLAERIQKIRDLLSNAKRAEPLEFSQMLTRYALGIVITLYAIGNPEFGTQLVSRPGSVAIMLGAAWAVGGRWGRRDSGRRREARRSVSASASADRYTIRSFRPFPWSIRMDCWVQSISSRRRRAASPTRHPQRSMTNARA